MDVLTPEQRSAMMARIRGKDTKPELLVRQMIHALGFRFRLHRRDLPGTPDIVFPRLRKIIFVHGCFWHRHQCRFAYTPKSNTEFWNRKFSANVERDSRSVGELRALGWRVFVVWECQTKEPSCLLVKIDRFLRK
jgi:DNA mismatch endonuclease (patch repair protein)